MSECLFCQTFGGQYMSGDHRIWSPGYGTTYNKGNKNVPDTTSIHLTDLIPNYP